MESNFSFFSWGIVAADKPDEDKFIEVLPIEVLPFFEGDVSDTLETLKFEGTDAQDQSYKVELKRSASVRAGWLGQTNRRTSPNVRKGEQVLLYTVGDTEEYYWTSIGRDDHLRRGETVVYTWNASGVGTDTDIEVSESNHYSMVMDTVNKQVTLSTTTDNGELTNYIVQLNTGDGSFTVEDGLGNVVQLDSASTKITLLNADSTYVTLDRKNIDVYAPNNITMLADNNVSIEAGKVLSTKSGKNTDMVAGAKFTLQAQSGVDIKTPSTCNITCNGFNVKSPKSTFYGVVTAPIGQINNLSGASAKYGSISAGSVSAGSVSSPSCK